MYQFSMCVAVEEFYKSKDNYKEAMIQIYDTFAAYYLVKYWHCIDNKSDSNNIVEEDETYYAQQIVSFLKYADGVDPMYEFSWLIKGFYELRQAASIPSYSNKTTQSEYNRAQKHFQSIVNNYTQSKKKLSPDSMVSRLAYGAYIGLVSRACASVA